MREACGVFGIYGAGEDVARITCFALQALQHRGQESAGIVTGDGDRIYIQTGMGLVSQAFDESKLAFLRGHLAIGHTRYSTTGSSRIGNAQPLVADGQFGRIALAHNGNVINAEALRGELEASGVRFQTTTDSEVILQMIVHSPARSLREAIGRTMRRITGAYCLTIATPDRLFAVRDPLGVRPLVLGRVNGAWVVASETCALDQIGAQIEREISPGEIIEIGPFGMEPWQAMESQRNALCMFEFIYFARPDSVMNDCLLHEARQNMGRELAREFPVEADLVIGVPDSATAAAIGYAREAGIPYGEGLMKNRYVGRTFIQPDQRMREAGAQLKYNPLPGILRGKRVVVVDDSIVRGTTTPRVVKLLKQAGVHEVHLRVCAPPIKHPCFFGVDMATRRELIAANMSVEEIRQHTGADSLGYLSLDGLIRAVGLPKQDFCLACLDGNYPVPVQLEMDKLALENVAPTFARA